MDDPEEVLRAGASALSSNSPLEYWTDDTNDLPVEFQETPSTLTCYIRNPYSRLISWLDNFYCLLLLILGIGLAGFVYQDRPLIIFCIIFFPQWLLLFTWAIRSRSARRKWTRLKSAIRISSNQLSIYASGSDPRRTKIWLLSEIRAIDWIPCRLPIVGLEYLEVRIKATRWRMGRMFWILWPSEVDDDAVLATLNAALKDRGWRPTRS